MVFINKVRPVLDVIEELSESGCVKGFRMRLGEGLMNSDSFSRIFNRFAEGTIFEDIDMEVEEVPVRYGCECGYVRNLSALSGGSSNCPRCGNDLEVVEGFDYELLDVF